LNYLNQADWIGSVQETGGNQAFINKLVLENGYKQEVASATRGNDLNDVVNLSAPKTHM